MVEALLYIGTQTEISGCSEQASLSGSVTVISFHEQIVITGSITPDREQFGRLTPTQSATHEHMIRAV